MISTFYTARGVPIPAVTAEQMREIDRIAIEETGPNLYQMMENAGRNLATHALDVLGSDSRTSPIVVLAGTGGNGGGGICAARHMANRGLNVTVVVTDEPRLGDVPTQQLAIYRATPGRVEDIGDVGGIEPSLVVDAIIGYSLRGEARGKARDLIQWANESGAPILSLDVPSGIDATTGSGEGAHIEATWTLTLALPKTGLVGPAVGNLYLADIGIPAQTHRRAGVDVGVDVFGDAYVIPITTGLNASADRRL